MEIKCPFCSKKFERKGWTDEHSSGDMNDMIAHCGADHCFTMYHLISDKTVLDTYQLFNIKHEVEDDYDAPIIQQVCTEPVVKI